MRIIAGEWRGRPLTAPTGYRTRPTSDRAREGLFSMLASRIGTFDGLRVADLFAGSGALGLEALSRGAAFALLVDSDRGAIAAIERNVTLLGAGDRAEISQRGVETLRPLPLPFDLIFLDPPYRLETIGLVLEQLASQPWLAPGGWISLEVSAPPSTVPPALVTAAERRFGKAHILLLRRSD